MMEEIKTQVFLVIVGVTIVLGILFWLFVPSPFDEPEIVTRTVADTVTVIVKDTVNINWCPQFHKDSTIEEYNNKGEMLKITTRTFYGVGKTEMKRWFGKWYYEHDREFFVYEIHAESTHVDTICYKPVGCE